MKLALYASTPAATTPNLVALQDETFAALPTVLVCPELARPIRRTALRRMGGLDEETSRLVMDRFLQLLAGDE